MPIRCLPLLLLALVAAAQEPPSTPGEPPHWPVGIEFPAPVVAAWNDPKATKAAAKAEADVLAWVPPGATRIRAVLLIANNTDLVRIGEHQALRDVAAKRGLGILYLRTFSPKVIETAARPEEADATFAAMLDLAAKATGLDDFRHVPWITLGKSSRGSFAFRTAWWFPERVLASIAYHGETPTWPMAAWSKVAPGQSVMHLNIQGLTEWDGTWYRHVRPSLLNYHRETGWLAHQVVVSGVDHGYYMDYYLYPNHGAKLEKDHRFIRVTQVWDYIAAFVDRALALRLPAEAPAVGQPVPLVQVPRDGGYLIHPRAPEELLATKWFALRRDAEGRYQTIPWPQEASPVLDPQQGIVPRDQLIRLAADVPAAERGDWMWIPDRDLLVAWLKLHDLYKLADQVPIPAPR